MRGLAAGLVLGGGAVLAQVPEDAMEAQRCIWRCQAEHGAASQAYGACVARLCDGTPQASAPPPAPAPTPAPTGVAAAWRFGPHPQLGATAHIITPAGSVGVGCGAEGGPPLGLRFSNSFSPQAPVTLIIDGGSYASGFARLQGEWSGRDGYACGDVPVVGLAQGAALYLIPAQIAAIHQEGAQAQITLTDGARQAVVVTGAQAQATFGGHALPLTGARAALQALLDSCPRARQDVEAGCGD